MIGCRPILRRVGLRPAVKGGMIIPISKLLDPTIFIPEPEILPEIIHEEEILPEATKICLEKERMAIKIA